MKHLNIDIQKASWLNEVQKEKLCKAFDTIRMKDVQEQGIDLLHLDVDRIFSYKQAMVGLLRALAVKEVSEHLGSDRVNEIGGLVEYLLNCFSSWDCDDMQTLLDIYDIYNYGHDDTDEKLNRLMKRIE